MSYANIRSLTEGSVEMQPFVYREKSSEESAHPSEAPVWIVQVLDVNFPNRTCCSLSIRNLVIH